MFKSLLLSAMFLVTAQAAAMEFACSPITGAGGGDFEFSKICLNGEYAVLTTGTFESTDYLYRVKRIGSTNRFSLTGVRVSDPNWRVGEPLTVTVSALAFRSTSLVEGLLGNKVTVKGSPNGSEGPYGAAAFVKTEIPITL